MIVQPWDGTELWKADLDSSGKCEGARKVFGDGKVNYQQFRFAPDNRLFCISDVTDWWNIYEADSDSGKLSRNVYPCEKDIGSPHWVFGCTRDFALGYLSQELKIIFRCEKKERSGFVKEFQNLFLHDVKTNSTEALDTGFSSHSYIRLGKDGGVYCLASSPTHVLTLIRFSPLDKKTTLIRGSRDDSVDPGYISIPTEIHFPTGKNQEEIAHGNLYEPKGFAVLDVNYRGSTGYGRKYRDSLRTRWGVADVEDCCYGARFLAKEKIVDGNKLCITGGSAGGYIVLRAAAWPGLFNAAVSKYGVSDVEALQLDTHKFEGRYNESLIAPYPEGVEIYRERSPIHHKDKLCCPVAFFQGLDDKVVPPSQTRVMFQAVKDKGLPTAVVEFEGEGHGFRKADNIRLTMDGEYSFFSKVLRIPPVVTVDSEKMTLLNFT